MNVTGSVAKKAKINILSPGITSELDRTKLSSKNATFVIKVAFQMPLV